MPRRRPTEAERTERREADRKRAQEAVEALRSSEGWQRWLGARRHFHSYSFVLSCRLGGVVDVVVAVGMTSDPTLTLGM